MVKGPINPKKSHPIGKNCHRQLENEQILVLYMGKNLKMSMKSYKKVCLFLMFQGSFNLKSRFLGQKVWPAAREQTHTHTKVTTVGALSGFQSFSFNLSRRIGPKRCVFFSYPKDQSIQKLESQVKKCALYLVDRQTDRPTDTKVNKEDTLSGFQEFLLQPIIKDR